MNEEKSIKLLDEFFEKTSDETLNEYIRRVNKMDVADDVAFEEYIKYLNEMLNNSLEEKQISNMKYKVGDKVRIKSLDWYYSNSDCMGKVNCGDFNFTTLQTNYCGKTLEILSVCDGFYIMKSVGHLWTDEMIEGLADEPQERMVSLDKVCELLKNIIDDDVLVKCGSVIKCMNVDDFVEYFCKVIEE